MHSVAAYQNPNVAKFTKLRQNVVKKEIRHKDVTINAMLTRTPCYLATLSFGHQRYYHMAHTNHIYMYHTRSRGPQNS